MSLHRAVVLLLAWVIAPLAIGSALLLLVVWMDEHAKVEQELHSWSKNILHTVDLHLGHRRSQLEAIAALPAMDSGDLSAIYQFARDVVADRPGTLVTLVGSSGQQLVKTSVPFGSPLPNLWHIEEQHSQITWQGHSLPVSSQGLTREVFRTGRVAYSGLFFGMNFKTPRLGVAVPVRRNDKVLYALLLSYPASDLDSLLNSVGLPRHARAVLLDQKGTVIANNGISSYAIAQQAPVPDTSAALQESVEPDGTRTASVYATSIAGYTVLVSLPRAIAYRTARNATIGWGFVSFAALLLSMLGAATLNRRLADPLHDLAVSVLSGEAQHSTESSNIHEIDLLAGALRAAAGKDEVQRQEHIKRIEAEKKEEAVAASEAQIRRVFAAIYVSVAVLDADGRLLEMNHAPAQRDGSKHFADVGQLYWECPCWNYDPTVQDTVRESVAEARQGRDAIRYNLPVRLEDGGFVMVDFQLSPLTDEKGNVTRLIACAVDVQDRVDAIRSLQLRAAEARETARKLDEQRWLLDAALEVTPTGMLVSDASGRLLRMNEANQRLWGAAPLSASVDGFAAWKGWWAQGQEHEGEAVQPHEWPLSRALQSGNPESSVIDIEPFDAPGVRKTVQVSAAPVLDEDGAVVGGVVVQMDITDRVRAEAALREADRHKDEFLATLGHELRNPLGPIRSAIHILRKYPPTEPRLIRAQEVIERQTKHMAHLVDDLLDIARITQGSIRMEQEIVVIHEIALAAVEAVAPALEAKGVRFRQEFAPEILTVQGDATRLSQALINLLNNAGKFTSAGDQVVLRVRKEGAVAVIEVADSGIGLAPDSVERIFGLFAQEKPSGAAGNSGLGIGLSLSRNLLAMHGGTLEAASAGLGKGSTFTARLPLVDAPVRMPIPSIRTQERGPSPRHRVLVVDDNRDGCDLMKELLEMSGFDVSTAYDGTTALAAVQKKSHDALVLDIGLPDINGYELCRRIRAQVGIAPVIIALTGWGQPQDKKAAEDAGFDTHVTKPADPDVLCNLLMNLLKRGHKPTKHPLKSAATSSRKDSSSSSSLRRRPPAC
jgi:signal transduction histidine kinase/DNA-binding NarL/FixJ family response regulator